MNQTGFEINFDGIIGPTHNYSGLSFGNIASMENINRPSNPKKAALQGLAKMKLLSDLGLKQAVLPPHERPHLPTGQAMGFSGADRNIPGKIYKMKPEYLYQISSAAPMWVANAATITPSIDSIDNHVHITPSNLCSMFHRSMESTTTSRVLKAIFPDPIYFTHHPALPAGEYFHDEGAANCTRFCNNYGGIGIHLFVYGKYSTQDNFLKPETFPARQSYEAWQCIVNSHELFPERIVIAQQNPDCIDAGVFHNDVIAVSNRHFFFFYEKAYIDMENVLKKIQERIEKFCDITPIFHVVPEEKIPVNLAVKTYLFNSQIIDKEEGMMALVCPIECQEDDTVRHYLDELLKDSENPIEEIHYVDLKESMFNGGGPACLRNRVILNQNELLATNPGIFMNEKLYKRLVEWINKHYRDELKPEDLADPLLVDECQAALEEISQILKLGRIYDFQK